MGQIVRRRRKKGRPSNSDPPLQPYLNSKSSAPESDYRRSLRRRNARPIIDYDDYLDEYEEELMLGDEDEKDDEEEEDDDEDERMRRRRRKKMKLQSVVKLRVGSDSTPVRTRRVSREAVYDDDEADAHRDLYEENDDDDDDEERGLKGEDSNGRDSAPGTPVEAQMAVPLPEKKLLELILDKLQKKDIYGVYAEPVDPEELPDYFDIIKHPMDFATVRKKLANGKYSTLDQIERDVLLICTNAMQYNEPDTVYHKQARTIQEMARKKFQKFRSDFERSEKQINTEERNKFNHIRMNPVKRSICRSSQEPVGSDFLLGAALATTGESPNGLKLPQIGSFGMPTSNDGLVEGNGTTIGNDVDKAEELVSGKNVPYKLGKKPFMLDENRRNTYKNTTQRAVGSDSIFATFEKEPKDLVSVGLQAEYSYARSLARFAGTLGPMAWNIAAKSIKEAVSQGVRFGRGWVGEYEPLSTPFLKFENQRNMGSVCLTTPQEISHLNVKINQKSMAPAPLNFNSCSSAKDRPVTEPVLEGRPSYSPVPNDRPTKRKPTSIGYAGSGLVAPVNTINPGRNPFSRNHLNGDGKVGVQNVSFTSNTNPDQLSFGAGVQLLKNSFAVPTGCTSQTAPKSMPFKQPDCNDSVARGVTTANVINSTFERRQVVGTFANNVSGPITRAAIHLGHGEEQQGVSDPVHLVRMLAEKTQNQQNCATHSPVSVSPVMSSVPSPKRDDLKNGSQISPRSWMFIGSNKISKVSAESPSLPRSHISADSLYNSVRDVQQVSRFHGETPGFTGLHFQMEKNHLPSQAYGRENLWLANKAQFQGHSANSTKLVTADLSRFQVPSPRQSLSSRPQATRQTIPPDLNVGFQLSGSPARQGTQVDPQQPDLALQL
ncbi:hypothetical protein QQ045_027823 [Rhodiola kirilowii]